jgi:hypothetical protein
MRWLIPVVLCSIALCVQAGGLVGFAPPAAIIDLDKPGALEALQRDNPRHYEAVMKKVDQAQTVAYSDKGLHDLGLFPRIDPDDPMGLGPDLKLSSPAQSHITVIVEGTLYAITVRHTKYPAHMVPAR